MVGQGRGEVVLTAARPCLSTRRLPSGLGWVPSMAIQFFPDSKWWLATGMGLAFCGPAGRSSGDSSPTARENSPQLGGAL